MTKVSCDYTGITMTLESIRNGGVVIFPTDTVYGIGCDPYNKEAVNRVYTIKKRDKTKGLPILGYSKHDLEKIVVFNETAKYVCQKGKRPGSIAFYMQVDHPQNQFLMNHTKH